MAQFFDRIRYDNTSISSYLVLFHSDFNTNPTICSSHVWLTWRSEYHVRNIFRFYDPSCLVDESHLFSLIHFPFFFVSPPSLKPSFFIFVEIHFGQKFRHSLVEMKVVIVVRYPPKYWVPTNLN